MKRILLLLLVVLSLFTGCGFVEDEYYSVKPHESGVQTQLPDAVEVSDYSGLRDAIMRFVKAGKQTGTIRTVEYDGSVEEDLVQAVYDVVRTDPVGAYAVDYLNHDCVKIVNYYEIRLSITFRRTAAQIASIQPAYTEQQLIDQVERSLKTWDDHLAMQITQDQQYDIAALVDTYCRKNPAQMPEIPTVAVSIYPESGQQRVLEVLFSYTNTPAQLQKMSDAVEESVAAAAEYIRYRRSDWDKTQLLYTYLNQRFTYREGSGSTPVYSALCEGIADPAGLAEGFAMICNKAGVACHVVTGLLDGSAHTWNIVSADGEWRHVDLAACILSGSGLRMQTDWEMSRYYWNTLDYPACVVAQKQEEPPEEPQPAPPAEEEPVEEDLS